MDLHFLLLMRHAKHSRGRLTERRPKGSTPLEDIASSLEGLAQRSGGFWHALTSRVSAKERPDGVLKAEGRYETIAVAKRLKEFLSEWTPPCIGKETPQPVTLRGVLNYDHDVETEARETATIFCNAYGFRGERKPSNFLGPKTKPADLTRLVAGNTGKRKGKSLQDAVKGEACELVTTESDAVLFVGHQPAIGWLANDLLKRAVPIVQSEIICIDLATKPPTLRWSISAAEEPVQDLQDKIKSKMALANLLSGFITAGLGVLLTMLADEKKTDALGQQAQVVFIAAACLLVAVAFYLRTMFSYDTLLMPVRFWAESSPGTSDRPPWIVARPPSGAHWILYQNMIRIWQWQFIPATFLTLSGLIMLWGAVTFASPRNTNGIPALPPKFIISVPVVFLALFLIPKSIDIVRGMVRGWRGFWSCPAKFRYLCGPWLGSED